MQICFYLTWQKPIPASARFFKSKETWVLLQEYVSRIQKYSPCEVKGGMPDRTAGTQTWICSHSKGSSMVSSSDLSRRLNDRLLNSTKTLNVLIGGPDGFDDKMFSGINADWIWSFGPLTLPHELASVVAAEQIYRSWTILKKLPYHSGH